MLKKNDVIPLTIENCSLNGSGVGHSDSMAIFVPMTLPGEQISAHILKVKKGYAFAKAAAINLPSPERAEPLCPVYSRCGGCAFRHASYEHEMSIKHEGVAQVLRRIGGIDIVPEPMLTAGADRYRNKAQYPVHSEKGEIKVGFYAPHSHNVVACRDCLLEPEIFADITDEIIAFATRRELSVYDEATGRGLLRHIYIRMAQATGEIMVCPVINGTELPFAQELVAALTSKFAAIRSIMLNLNTKMTNVILGERCVLLWGKERITDSLCSLKFGISPLSFYQVNHDGAQQLYGKAGEYAALTGSETVLDLYCGAGTIGLTMASKAKQVIGVEIVPEAVEDAKYNAALNGIENAEFICDDAPGAAARLAGQGIKPDVIILDPPRKGCTPELIATVAGMAAPRVVYVSCDPATLARDCAIFAEQGYRTCEVTPVNMFPRTAHIENVVLLSREKV